MRDGAMTAGRGAILLAALMIGFIAASPVRAQDDGDSGPGAKAEEKADRARDTLKRTGLPLPRYASLRASEVYMRTGPGTRYPVEWIYRRRGLPVQIIAEFDTWRKVRDWNGTVGWVHRAMLSGRRTAMTINDDTVLRRSPAVDAPAMARAEPGVVARILKCDGAWCRIEARGIKGWAPRATIWGTLPGERVD